MIKMKTKKPSKQRRRLYKGKLHERKNVLSAHLSKELRKETGKRSLMVKKGDKIKIMRGQHKKKEGKILQVDHKKAKIFIEKITRKKADGTEKLIPFKASNLVLLELERKDDKRLKRAKQPFSKKKLDQKTEKEEKEKETKTEEKQPFLEKKVATQTKSLSAQQNQDFVSEQKTDQKKEAPKETPFSEKGVTKTPEKKETVKEEKKEEKKE